LRANAVDKAPRFAYQPVMRAWIKFPVRAGNAFACATARRRSSLDLPFAWWLCFAAGFAFIASRLSTDGSFDLENYHLYNGFAAFHDRSALDIAPAQLQTSFYYGLDVVYYTIFRYLDDRPLIVNLLLSIPYSLAALAVLLIARLFATPSYRWPVLMSIGAAIFGLSGATNLATLATTESDLVPGLPILAALARWLTLEKAQRSTAWTALGVGGLAGVSVGLKLTQAPLFIGMLVAIAVRFASGKRSALLEAIAFGLGGLVVFAALDGAWLWANFKAYGNPIFPLMNNVFQSDLITPSDWTDRRFLPRTTAAALFYPTYWAFRLSTDVSELLMRDPRILLGCVSAFVIMLGFAIRWIRDRAAPPIGNIESLGFSLAVVFLLSYALWEKVWSIYRYLAVDESLSGVLLLAALPVLFGVRSRSWLRSGLFALIVIWASRTTVYPWWPRVPRGPEAISVHLPPLEPNAMVLFLDSTPYSFIVPWMPISTRAIGVNNNLVHPGAPGRLWSIIEAAVRDHQGPLWGVEDPRDNPGTADGSLTTLGLARDGDCTPLNTNMETGEGGEICKLRRTSTP
jgi:hypothetical protein